VETEVVIAGAGPVGMALSIALSNLGIANVVVERGAGVHPLPRAAVIDAELHQAFILHGLGDELAPLLTPIRAADYVDAKGKVLVGGDVSGIRLFDDLPSASFHFQPEIDALFLRELQARGGGWWVVTGRQAPFGGRLASIARIWASNRTGWLSTRAFTTVRVRVCPMWRDKSVTPCVP